MRTDVNLVLLSYYCLYLNEKKLLRFIHIVFVLTFFLLEGRRGNIAKTLNEQNVVMNMCKWINPVLFFSFRPLVFPFVPARELSSISSWREFKASRKLHFAELWPTSGFAPFPFLNTSETNVLSDLSLSVLSSPCSSTRFINETIFPIMFVNEVRIPPSTVRKVHAFKEQQNKWADWYNLK